MLGPYSWEMNTVPSGSRTIASSSSASLPLSACGRDRHVAGRREHAIERIEAGAVGGLVVGQEHGVGKSASVALTPDCPCPAAGVPGAVGFSAIQMVLRRGR